MRFGVVSVTTPSRDGLLADLKSRLSAGRGFAVATLNLDHLVKLRRDPAFRTAYTAHSHVVADGNPVVWLNRIAGRPAELVTGSDLVLPLAALAAELGTPVALLGSTEAALEATEQRLVAGYPGLRLVARIAPPQGFDPLGPDAAMCLETLRESGARLCLVALGAPKQEVFVARAIACLPCCGFVSVGAGLDFIAGRQRRAPLMLRRFALEWLWRLVTDHRRLGGRYRDCAVILPGLVGLSLKQRFLGQARPAGADGQTWGGGGMSPPGAGRTADVASRGDPQDRLERAATSHSVWGSWTSV